MEIKIIWKEVKEFQHIDYTASRVKIDDCLGTANESLAKMLDSYNSGLKRIFVEWFKKYRKDYDLSLILKHCKKNKHIY